MEMRIVHGAAPRYASAMHQTSNTIRAHAYTVESAEARVSLELEFFTARHNERLDVLSRPVIIPDLEG